MKTPTDLPPTQEEGEGSSGELQASVPPGTDRENGGVCSLLSDCKTLHSPQPIPSKPSWVLSQSFHSNSNYAAI